MLGDWERWVVLVLDDSVEHCRELLALIRKTRPSLAVIAILHTRWRYVSSILTEYC